MWKFYEFQCIYSSVEEKERWNNTLNNIKAFCFHQAFQGFYDSLLEHRSNQLLSLHIDDELQSSKGFANLQELCIMNVNEQKIQNITNTAKKLKRVHLQFTDYEFNADNAALIG